MGNRAGFFIEKRVKKGKEIKKKFRNMETEEEDLEKERK